MSVMFPEQGDCAEDNMSKVMNGCVVAVLVAAIVLVLVLVKIFR
jgi:hypothetical protein